MKRIFVTPDHIAAGLRDDCDYNPVALALQGAGIPNARADIEAIKLPWGLLKTSEKVQGFLTDFDAGIRVKPFWFVIPEDGDE